MITLLKTSTLSFTQQASAGYYVGGEWVDPPNSPAISVEGSLQPYKSKGSLRQSILPEGKSSGDARIFYTSAVLKTATQFGDTEADETTIDGNRYYVWLEQDWSLYGLTSDHHTYVLIREDQQATL